MPTFSSRAADGCSKATRVRSRASGGGWVVTTEEGPLQAREAVVALGPWSGELMRSLGLRLPFGVKRGYHMHYAPRGNAGLSRPVLDLEKGYLVTPMARGLRLTTGAEFARRDDPAVVGPSRPAGAVRARNVPARRAARRKTLARATALPARHDADHRPLPAP